MGWPPLRGRKGSHGRYVWRDGHLLKIGDKIHTLFDAYVPEHGYVDEHLGYHDEKTEQWVPAHITSREAKGRTLKERNLVEDTALYGQKLPKVTYFDVGSRRSGKIL